MDSRENNQLHSTSAQTDAMESAPPQRKSVWSMKDRIVRLLWGTLGRLVWACCPCLRITCLRAFGGKVGTGCKIASSVEITVPWHITMGDNCHIAEHVILYSLGSITLGSNVRIDTRAHLCAGSHDMRDTTFPLTRPPISIGDDSFIGIDAYIGPNVSLGKGTCVHPRASVYKSYGDDIELQGNPARPMS